MVSWSPRLSRAAAVLCAAVAGLAVAAPASAATRDVPFDGPLAKAPAGLPDRVIGRHVPVAGAAALARPARIHSYQTSDGQQVEVAVSAAYPENPVADRALVDYLVTRVHGSELGELRLFVGRPDEVSALCGGGRVVACYAIDEARMYVPGQDTPEATLGYVLTHEYGHHIAASRSNEPWDALDWGPKHWASAAGVCAGVARRQLFPGDQGAHYFDDPGEGFADGYAHLHFPSTPWRYNALLRPTGPLVEAIRRDVQTPWTGPRTRTAEAQRHARLRVRLSLDGDITVRVRARRGERIRLEARSQGWAVGRTLRAGDRIGIQWCRKQPGDSVLRFSARRLDGRGPVRLVVRYPG